MLLLITSTLAFDWHRIQWPWMTMNAKMEVFMDILAISGCETDFKSELRRN